MDKDFVWKNVMGQIRLNVSEGTFTAFLKPLILGSIRDIDEKRQLVEIYCPSSFVRDTAEQRFWGQIKTTLDGLTDKKNELVFSVRSVERFDEVDAGVGRTTSGKRDKNPSGTVSLFENSVSVGNQAWIERARKIGIRDFSTFETFAVSSSNQMAHAAAVAVSDKPGSAYNPLFLWGGVGVGKTHLMQAVGNSLLMKSLDIKIVYCSGEEFTNDIVMGIRSKSMDRVRDKYRRVQLLLLDDIQFIAGKEAVQEEFFHTFNAIQKVGGQVVLTSDRQPHEIAKLEDRLRSRFEAGLIVDISPPDFALRSAITLIKAEQKGFMISSETAQAIAQYADSARKIEGVLTKLATIKTVRNTEITPELVKEVLEVKENSDVGTNKIVTPAAILDLVAENFGVSVAAIRGNRRMSSIVAPRMIAMYLLRTDLMFPFEEVGRIVGGRDHSTVMHAVKKVELGSNEDASLRHHISEIRKKMFGNIVEKIE